MSARHPFETAGLRVAASQDRILASSRAVDADMLLAGVLRRRRAEARRRVGLGALASACVVLLGLFVALRVSRPDVVAARTAAPALGVTQANVVATPIAFEDGTRVTVKLGSTAELQRIERHGAKIRLHEGTVEVDVVHTDESRWDILAGDFEVRVTGTRFEATWDPRAQRLTVAMREGTVRVSGACVDEPLSAPATKTFACERAVTAPTDPAIPTDALPLTSSRPAAIAKPPTAANAPSGASPLAPDANPTSAPELLALGDGARLGGDSAQARVLYTKVRERFPASEHSAKAAFLLGRLEEADGALDEAVRDYAAATSDSPTGAFGRDALGRTMEIEQRRGRGERARALASRYLESFPRGPHAAYASSILAAHP